MNTRHTLRLFAALAVVSAVMAASCDDSTAPKATARTINGETRALGQGTAHTWVSLSASGTPTAIGISISEAALTALPGTPMPGMPSALMLSLPLPTEAKATGFDHGEISWNPLGHDPVQIYGAGHFDFHFYSVSDSVQRTILPTDPQFATKAASLPSATVIPTGYSPPPGVAAASTIPMMGLHWTSSASSEYNGQPFTSTFILGSYDGKFIFIEPMITKAFLETHPNATYAVPQPAKWTGSTYFPGSYSVSYDATAKEYRVSLLSLAKKE